MRVLLINDHARVTGGADIHCLELSRLLNDRGHEVRLLSTTHPENMVTDGAFVPQRVNHATRDSLGPVAAGQVATTSCWNRTVAAATDRILDDFAPDVIHAHKLYPQLSVAPVVMAARRSVPVLQTAHDYEFVSASAVDHLGRRHDRDEDRLAYRVLNSVLFRIKRAVHVPRVAIWITVSRALADVYRQRGRIEAVALPNFVAPSGGSRPPLTERDGALFVGRLAREKGVDQIIELARRLPKLPVAISGFGPMAPQVERAAAEIPNLTFSGPIDSAEVDRQMRLARLAIMPSLWQEPAGLVALEAMRAGTPIVAYERGGLAEYVGDANAGVVVPPNLDDLAAGVESLLESPARWQRCAEAGAEAADTTHAPDTYIDRLESLYVAAASGTGRAAAMSPSMPACGQPWPAPLGPDRRI